MIDLQSVVWIILGVILAVVIFALLFGLNRYLASKLSWYAPASVYVEIAIVVLAFLVAIFFLLSFFTGRPVFHWGGRTLARLYDSLP